LESLTEHIDFVQFIFGIAIGIVGWFAIRTLRQIDRNQAELYSRLNVLSERFYRLEGEHRAFRCNYSSHEERP
jgi:hypothetical protein